MMHPTMDAFSARLKDLLMTLEPFSLLGSASSRVRGLGEQLRFACLAVPCDEALVALEIETLGRLAIPVIATADEARATELEILPSGTPFAFLLGGGGGHAAEIGEDDPMIAPFASMLWAPPASGIFVPVRAGDSVVGGAALFAREKKAFGDRELAMAERLAEVLSLTVECFRTERALFEVFCRALPDLLSTDAPTTLRAALDRHIAVMRAAPSHKRSLELAASCARLASLGDAEARLAADIMDRVEAHLRGGET